VDRESATTLSRTQLDALTQLPNRAALITYLHQKMTWAAQHRQQQAHAVRVLAPWEHGFVVDIQQDQHGEQQQAGGRTH
ncbi:hypothetical protein ACSLNH_17040, partial [Comamonas kerstersii]|uniref:hypothetical protein n=1 Tax=Comamonas kerstersii TaxID=225992 RepID=UPI003EE1AA0B